MLILSLNLQICLSDPYDLCQHFLQTLATSCFGVAICKGCLSGIDYAFSPLLHYIIKAWTTGGLWPLFYTFHSLSSQIYHGLRSHFLQIFSSHCSQTEIDLQSLSDIWHNLPSLWDCRCVFIALLTIVLIYHTFTTSTGLSI